MGDVVPERGPLEVSAHEYRVVWVFIIEESGDPAEYVFVFEFALCRGRVW